MTTTTDELQRTILGRLSGAPAGLASSAPGSPLEPAGEQAPEPDRQPAEPVARSGPSPESGTGSAASRQAPRAVPETAATGAEPRGELLPLLPFGTGLLLFGLGIGLVGYRLRPA